MSLRRALAFSYLEKYAALVIALASTAVISRLLGPADIGVFAVGMALVGLVAVVRELGVSTYVVQEAALSDDRIRSAFTLTAGMGLILALLMLLISWPAGRYYGDARVTQIIAILSIGFALTPLGSISQALLARNLQFGTLAWVKLLYSVVNACVSIGLVVAGFGPVSLAWAAVAAALVTSIVSLAARPHPMRLSFKAANFSRVMGVGGPATGIAIIDDVASSLPELLLGRMQGFAAAGLFSRARGLSAQTHQLLVRAAGPVFFAAFSALKRDGQSAEPLYIKATISVTAVGWMALAVLGVLAEPIVLLLYGPSWSEVVPLLRWLCVAAAIALLTSGANHLLLASGGSKEALWAKVGALPVHVACLTVGGSFGAEAMAMASVPSALFGGLMLNIAVQRRLQIGLAAQFSAFRTNLPATIASAAGASSGLLISAQTPAQALASIALGGSGCILLGLVALMAGNHPLKEELLRAAGRLSAHASRLR